MTPHLELAALPDAVQVQLAGAVRVAYQMTQEQRESAMGALAQFCEQFVTARLDGHPQAAGFMPAVEFMGAMALVVGEIDRQIFPRDKQEAH